MILIHISDLHFREGETGTAFDPHAARRHAMVADAVRMCDHLGGVPTAIILSGDVAFAGASREYDMATRWLEDLCARCGAKESAVFSVPGNHDVQRAVASRPHIAALHQGIKRVARDTPTTLDAYLSGILRDQESAELLYRSIANYNLFAERFFCGLLPPDRTIAMREFPLSDGSVLRLVGLNSTFVSSSADEKETLFVDPAARQLISVAGVETVSVCHHPPHWIWHGFALQDHLDQIAKVQLHGHDHTNRVLEAQRFLRVAAGAAQPDPGEPEWEPGYNLLEVRVEGEDCERRLQVTAHVRVWQSRPGLYRAKLNQDREESFQVDVRLDPWRPEVTPRVDVDEVALAPAPSPGPARRLTAVLEDARDVSIAFFALSFSQKLAVAGRLDLLEEGDIMLPDFERFRRVLMRASERGELSDLSAEIKRFAPRS